MGKNTYTGVSLHKNTGTWRAYVSKQGKQYSAGYHRTEQEALAARNGSGEGAARRVLPCQPLTLSRGEGREYFGRNGTP